MRKLETFVNEKLRVTKGPTVPDLIAIVESKDRKEFQSRCKQLSEYLNNDSDLPLAELKDWQNGLKKLARKYKTSYDTFLWVFQDVIIYGTWDDIYNVYWSRIKEGVKNYNDGGSGFKDFACNDQELTESKGVYIITEDTEFMEQIDILKQKSDPE